MGRVVVGVDARMAASPALIWASDRARHRAYLLDVVSVWTYPPLSTEEQLLTTPGMLEDEARTLTSRQIEDVLGPRGSSDVRVGVQIVRGPPAKCLLDAAEGADLLVVGRRDRARLRHLVLGSVADQCIRHAPCPTAVVPHIDDAEPGAGGPIVVGLDGSSTARRALEWALEEAERLGTAVRVVHCWWEPMPPVGDVPMPAADVAALDAAAHRRLNTWLSDVGVPEGVSLERLVRRGNPGATLVEEAATAGLVVVGTRGQGGFARLLMGSVARQVVHRATCPIVVLPHLDED